MVHTMNQQQSNLENDEDSGYGIFCSEDEISVEPPRADELPVYNVDADSSSADESQSPGGLFGCPIQKALRAAVSGEQWAHTPASSYSSRSDDEEDDEQDAAEPKRCFLYPRGQKSEQGEISALIASLIRFSTSTFDDAPRLNKARARPNTLTVNSHAASCLTSILPFQDYHKNSTRQTHDSPITLLPSLNSPWGSFSSLATFLYSEKYSEEEMIMLDGDLPTLESDLTPRIIVHNQNQCTDDTALSSQPYLRCRSFHVVTTAALPWTTGTAVNPLLRAAYLNQMNRKAVEAFSAMHHSTQEFTPFNSMGTVTLVIPWLIHPSDRQELYGPNFVFDSPSQQEAYIRLWLRNSAHLPLEADLDTHGIHIMYVIVHPKQHISFFGTFLKTDTAHYFSFYIYCI